MDLSSLLGERRDRWRRDPLLFFTEVLGVEEDLLWSAMQEMVTSVRENRWTAVAGCHNSSKTFTAACLTWWWVTCWQPAIVYVTAPKEDQLKDTFWSQLRQRYEQAVVPLGGSMGALEWKVSPETMIVGRTSRKDTGAGGSTSMQGYKSQRLLMIFDEATGIDRSFWESAMGVVTFPENRWLALANPTNPNCGFRDCWRPDSGWRTINIDALANPNLQAGRTVHPYLATAEWVEDARKLWGEGSPSWESRVRGRFPSAAIDTLISIADFEMALDREPGSSLDLNTYVGADIAAQGDDYSVISVIQGDDLVHLEWFHEPDTTRTADRIVRVARDWGIEEGRAHQVAIDMGGMGKGPYDHIRRFYRWNIRGIDFGSNPVHVDLYADRRTEMWVGVRDWLRSVGSFHTAKSVDTSWIRHLEADLCGSIVDPLHIKGGKTVLKLEKKVEMKKRLGHSPDHGDSLALALLHRTSQRGLDRSSLLTKTAKSVEDPRVNTRMDPEAERKEKRRKKQQVGMYDDISSIGGLYGE